MFDIKDLCFLKSDALTKETYRRYGFVAINNVKNSRQT